MFQTRCKSLEQRLTRLTKDYNDAGTHILFLSGIPVSDLASPALSEHLVRIKDAKELAIYIAEGLLHTAKLRSQPPNQNLFNIDRIRGYSSLGFIRRCASSIFDESGWRNK